MQHINYHIIGIINIFFIILGIFVSICVNNYNFINMCFDDIILFYILIIINICSSVYIYILFIYLHCYPDTIYKKFIYYIIQSTEIILIIYQFIIFFVTNTCFNMEFYTLKDNFYNIVRNTYIFVLFLCSMYILFFICIITKIL